MKILTCNSNRPLAEAISAYLDLPLTQASVRRFSDMEVFVEIQENVRGEDVFVIQSTSYPANDHLMELLVTLDALKRASARRITAVIPYYGYARQDRKIGVAHADLGQARRQPDHRRRRRPGADPRSPCRADPGLLRHPDRQSLCRAGAGEGHPRTTTASKDLVIVSPDVGGVVRARDIARRVDADLAIIDKRRERAGVSEVMNIIGDVDGPPLHPGRRHRRQRRHAVQRRPGADRRGAKAVYAYVTHGVLSGGAVARVAASPIEKLVLTDSIVATEAVRVSRNIRQLTIAPLMAEAILRISEERSVSSLFD